MGLEKQQSYKGHLGKAGLLACCVRFQFSSLHVSVLLFLFFFKHSIYTLIHAGSAGYASAYLAYPVAPPLFVVNKLEERVKQLRR
jgi:hypothetical protein